MNITMHNTAVGGFNFEVLRAMSTQGTGGTELGECLLTADRIHEDNFESWIVEWQRTADVIALEAEQALREAREIRAGHVCMRAASYYRLAEFFATHEDPRHEHAWKRSRECFQQAINLLCLPVEPLLIPFEDTPLPGYFVSGGDGKRPLLLAMSGFDGSGEELYHWIGAAAAERGWHCLIFEGPGQRGALHLHPGLLFRHDYEVPVRAVVDYATSRPEVDAERLALIGYSFGGHLAPRVAAFEPRLSACIADPLTVDVGTAWTAAWPALMRSTPAVVFDTGFFGLSRLNAQVRWSYDQARWSMGIGHPHEFFAAFAPYTLKGLEERLRTPMLLLFGEDEIAQAERVMLIDTMHYIGALTCPRRVHLFLHDEGAASHCQIGGLSRAQAVIFDWLEETLPSEGKQQPEQALTSNRSFEQLTAVVKQYHGEEAAKSVPQIRWSV
jgi:hypothetical protein